METDQVLDVDELNVVVDCVLAEVYAEVLKERIEKTATSILTCGRPDQPVSLVLKHGHEKKFWICFHWFYGIPFCSPDLVLNSRVQHLEFSVGDLGCLVLSNRRLDNIFMTILKVEFQIRDWYAVLGLNSLVS